LLTLTPDPNPERPRLRSEVVGGLTTFFTTAYIVVMNPAILASPGTGMAFSGVLTATVLVCATMTLLMGLYARLPFAVAPGMGVNAFFAYTVILGAKVPWPTALGMIFWAGVLFVLLSLTPVRLSIARAIPASLRTGSAVGIGLFLTFIGLKNAGLVVANSATLVSFGRLDGRSGLALCGLLLMTALLRRRNPFAFLAGIGAVTAVSAALGWVSLPEHPFSAPDFRSVFLGLDVLGSLRLTLLPTIVAILFTDLFDSISSLVGVSYATGLLDEKGQPRRLGQALLVDAFATLGAGIFGSSSGTAYIESAAGIEAGGRTGLSAVVTALCFLPCLFIAPLAAMVPPWATAPVLILVGALMFRSARELPVERYEEMLPAYLAVALIPLSFSITQGMLWAFLAHALLYTLAGRRREVTPVMWVIAALSAGLVLLDHIHGQ